MAIVDNQKIMFKAGAQAAYNGMSSRDSGTFYVTTDTHRLYLGDNLLSQAVQFVNALPNTNIDTGTIYYLTTANALAVYDGNKWVQLNPDTYLKSVSFSADAESDGTPNITLSISQTGGKDNTFSGKVIFAAGKNASVTKTNDTITIAGPDFGLNAEGITNGKTILASGSDSVEFVAGDNVTITPAAGKVTIASSYQNTTITSNSFIADIDDKGNFNYTSTLTDSTGKSIPATKQTITPIIEYGTSKATAKFLKGQASLDVYTKAEVDAIAQTTLDAVNAMTYKGTVGSGTSTLNGSTLPSTGVKIGDVYMSDQTGNVTGTGVSGSYPAGTIFIATGTETNGVITADLKWNAVQTGANDTTYSFEREGNTVHLKDSHNKKTGSITIDAEAGGRVAVSVSNSDHDPVFTVSHTKVDIDTIDAAAKTQNAGANLTFKALTDIEVDAYGHITKAKMSDITVRDTLAKLKSATTEATSGAKTSATVSTSFTLDNGVTDTTQKTSFSLNSTTLALSATGSAVTVDLTWGTF